MQLQHLKLTHFRNIVEAQLQFSPGVNVIVGQNGQGKTNILEAISFLSLTKSLRAGEDRELVHVNHRHEGGSLQGRIHSLHTLNAEADTLIEARFIPGAPDRLKTQFRLNTKGVKSRSQVVGVFPTVSFFLPDLLMLRGTPSDRRRWLDAALSQVHPTHFQTLSQYQKVREQKAQFLKQCQNQAYGELLSPSLRTMLEVWNDQLVPLGVEILQARLEYLARLTPQLSRFYEALSGAQEASVNLAYHGTYQNQTGENAPSFLEALSSDSETLEAYLRGQLEARMVEECRRAQCVVGPHRDDVGFFLGSMDATTYGSQGQQRTLVLAAKLSEVAILQEERQEPPVLLLDDVMAELDQTRQAGLLHQIGRETQVFLTTTHLDALVLKSLEETWGELHVMDSHETSRIFQIVVHGGQFTLPSSTPSPTSFSPALLLPLASASQSGETTETFPTMASVTP